MIPASPEMMAGAFKSFEVQVYQGTDKREKKEKRLVIYLSVTLFSLLPMALNAPPPPTLLLANEMACVSARSGCFAGITAFDGPTASLSFGVCIIRFIKKQELKHNGKEIKIKIHSDRRWRIFIFTVIIQGREKIAQLALYSQSIWFRRQRNRVVISFERRSRAQVI